MKNTIIIRPRQNRGLITPEIFLGWVMFVLIIAGSIGCKKSIELDHFKTYTIATVQPFDQIPVGFMGQFDGDFMTDTLFNREFFANPVLKDSSKYYDKNAHLFWYRLSGKQPGSSKWYTAENQFARLEFKVGYAKYLLVPTHKIEKGSSFPKDLDHFVCYDFKQLATQEFKTERHLKDQFFAERIKLNTRPKYFCVPVLKKVKGKQENLTLYHEDLHLTVYEILNGKAGDWPFTARDQFSGQNPYQLTAIKGKYLCVPTWDKKAKEQ